MNANSSKFQSIVLDNVLTDELTNFSFNVRNTKIGLPPWFHLVEFLSGDMFIEIVYIGIDSKTNRPINLRLSDECTYTYPGVLYN